jgi:hypothetical protein
VVIGASGVHFADGEQILWGGGAATWGEWEEEEVSGDLVVYLSCPSGSEKKMWGAKPPTLLFQDGKRLKENRRQLKFQAI